MIACITRNGKINYQEAKKLSENYNTVKALLISNFSIHNLGHWVKKPTVLGDFSLSSEEFQELLVGGLIRDKLFTEAFEKF